MQLTIYLKDGRKVPFAIADGQASADFLKGVKYWEIFDRPILRIHDRRDTWAFNPDAIEKIHFETAEDPGWRLAENILSAKCVTRESYQRRMAALDANAQEATPVFEVGQVLEAMLTITLASGANAYFECILMLRERREQLINLYQLFQKIAYAIPCESGGFVLLNPKNIFCIHLHPAPPEGPDSAWQVDECTGQEAELGAAPTGSGRD